MIPIKLSCFLTAHSFFFFFFQRGLVPTIPPELALSFYLQSWKLIFAVYHIVTDPKTNTSKFNRYQAEAVIPWVNDVALYLTIALQTAQQLKDKVYLFYEMPMFVQII